jgi:hypothetical protein
MIEHLAVTLRSATEDELIWVRQTWGRCARVRTKDYEDGTGEWVPVGRRTGDLCLDPAMWTRLHNRLIDDVIADTLRSGHAAVLVADLDDPDCSGAPIAWVAFEPGAIHHVFVAPDSRRCRVAEQVVRFVTGRIGTAWRPTYLTAAGQPFLQHLAAVGLAPRQHASRSRGQPPAKQPSP